MKQSVARRKPENSADYLALALTTWGVGYIPGAPGTYGSGIAVIIYLAFSSLDANIGIFLLDHRYSLAQASYLIWALNALLLSTFVLIGIWASGRSVPLLGNSDPHSAVVDEVMGQLVTFCFVPFGLNWPFILAGFLLFRLFDIWKPYPIDDLQVLPGGIGICGDDIIAGVYAGICLAIGYAITISL
ncbi:MAG: phosphatidylglycerophosphatase A [Pyrinomonadaceae bacterium]